MQHREPAKADRGPVQADVRASLYLTPGKFWKSPSCVRRYRPGSCSILPVAFERRVQSLEESLHFGHGADGNEFDAIVKTNDLEFFSGTQADALAHSPRDNHLKFWRECYGNPIDPLSVLRLAGRYMLVNFSIATQVARTYDTCFPLL